MVLIIAILNYGTIMTISKDIVKPSPTLDSWKLKEIFATGVGILSKLNHTMTSLGLTTTLLLMIDKKYIKQNHTLRSLAPPKIHQTPRFTLTQEMLRRKAEQADLQTQTQKKVNSNSDSDEEEQVLPTKRESHL